MAMTYAETIQTYGTYPAFWKFLGIDINLWIDKTPIQNFKDSRRYIFRDRR